MLSSVWSLMLPVLIRVKQWIVVWASSAFTGACIALLCMFVLRLFVYLLVQHDSTWRHVSILWDA